MNKALRILRGVVPQKQSEVDDLQEASKAADEILKRQARMESLAEEGRLVRQEMARVAVFGDFNQQDIHFIEEKGKRVVQFFYAKNKENVPDASEMIYVGQDHNLYYYITVNKEKASYDHMVEMIVDRSHGELLKRKKEIEDEVHQIESLLKELSTFKSLIKQAVIHEFNTYYLKMNHNFVDYHWEESFFSTEVWIAKTSINDVERLLESFSIYMTEIQIEDEERIPTHLENTGPNRVGEDLVYIYDTPSIEDKDPSGWVLWAFALFFAFIVGDGGYGFIFLILFFLMRWKVKEPSKSVQRFNKLLGILSISCIVWGFCVSSFFGINISLENGLKRYSPLSYMVEKKLSYHMAQNDETYNEVTQKFPDLKKVRLPYEFFNSSSCG